METIVNKQKNVLKRLLAEFNEAEIAAIYEREEETELAVDIVSCLEDEFGADSDVAEFNFFFIPQADCPENMQFFESYITLNTEVIKEQLMVVAAAASIMNQYLAYGAFVVDMPNAFVRYKLSVPMVTDLDEDTLYKEINACATLAIELAEQYAHVFARLSAGEMEFEEFIGMVPQLVSEEE